MGHFYFVRHGQTVWNVENKICGATDSPLTEYGREQLPKPEEISWKTAFRQTRFSIRRLAVLRIRQKLFQK